jgi:broad specificity phosphatase PhoE
MELFIIRHGQSANNALADPSQRVQDPPITPLGERQADQLAAFIRQGKHLSPAERSSERPYFDQLYCSAMRRSLQTVRPVGEALGMAPEVWVDIHETGGIFLDHGAEQGVVGYGGMNREQIEREFPGFVVPPAIGADGWWDPARGQEKMHEGIGRAIGVEQTLRSWALQERRIGIVVHGDFMSILIKALGQQLPGTNLHYQHENTAITRVDFHLQDWTMSQDSIDKGEAANLLMVRYVNRVEHLTDELIS